VSGPRRPTRSLRSAVLIAVTMERLPGRCGSGRSRSDPGTVPGDLTGVNERPSTTLASRRRLVPNLSTAQRM